MHFFVAASLALPALESRAVRATLPVWTVPVSAGVLAVAPDLDSDAVMLLGLPRTSFFLHRGVFHSPVFLIVAAVVLALLAARRVPRARLPLAALWAVAMTTHPLLDALTNGGGGVMLLFPFRTGRFFFPWRPIHVSPLSVEQFYRDAAAILWSELPFCLLAAAIGLTALLVRKRYRAIGPPVS